MSTAKTPHASAQEASRNEDGESRASMNTVGVYERPARRAAMLPKPLMLVLLILAVVSGVIFLKSLF